MYDTVSDGAVTALFSVVQGFHVCKRNAERALKPKCQQTTVKARTIDGVTSTTICSLGHRRLSLRNVEFATSFESCTC